MVVDLVTIDYCLLFVGLLRDVFLCLRTCWWVLNYVWVVSLIACVEVLWVSGCFEACLLYMELLD